jgi:molybdopterin molybdotransferase
MSDCCSPTGLLPFHQALSMLLDSVTCVEMSETLAITDALGRVLAHDIESTVDVPPHNNSAMDGYAFAYSSVQQAENFTLVGKSFAGAPFTGKAKSGECIQIMTGAKMPACCDTVVMQENVRVDHDKVWLTKAVKLHDHVRYVGEDIAKGSVVLTKGKRLNAVDIGLLASLGFSTVTVYCKLTAAILSTGDELRQPGDVLNDGDIFESNRFALKAMLERQNLEILDLGIIRDNKKAICDAFIRADKEADIVISTGGVSVGEADYTKEVLAELGKIDFWKVAMKPGKPFAFGKLPDSVFFGLPGNPVSALVTFHQLAVPGIIKMQGQQVKPPIRIKAKSIDHLKKSPGRTDFQRGILSVNEHGSAVVRSTQSQGSGILSSLSKANCYIVLAQEQGNIDAGEYVTVQPFDYLIT